MKATLITTMALSATGALANNIAQYKALAGGYLRCASHGQWHPAGNLSCEDIDVKDLPNGEVPKTEFIYSERDKKYFRCVGLGRGQEFQCDLVDKKKLPKTWDSTVVPESTVVVEPTMVPEPTPTETTSEVVETTTETATETATEIATEIATETTTSTDVTLTTSYGVPTIMPTESWITVIHTESVGEPSPTNFEPYTETLAMDASSTTTRVCTLLPEIDSPYGGFPKHRWDSCGRTLVHG